MKSKITMELNDSIVCSHCSSSNYYKKGFVSNKQRYYCKNCKRLFTMKPTRFPEKLKLFAVFLCLNNTGIRKCAKIIGVSPPTILR